MCVSTTNQLKGQRERTMGLGCDVGWALVNLSVSSDHCTFEYTQGSWQLAGESVKKSVLGLSMDYFFGPSIAITAFEYVQAQCLWENEKSTRWSLPPALSCSQDNTTRCFLRFILWLLGWQSKPIDHFHIKTSLLFFVFQLVPCKTHCSALKLINFFLECH